MYSPPARNSAPAPCAPHVHNMTELSQHNTLSFQGAGCSRPQGGHTMNSGGRGETHALDDAASALRHASGLVYPRLWLVVRRQRKAAGHHPS